MGKRLMPAGYCCTFERYDNMRIVKRAALEPVIRRRYFQTTSPMNLLSLAN